MSGEKTCTGCSAPLEDAHFVCVYCGRTTNTAAKTAEEEIDMLRELSSAVQSLVTRGATTAQLEAFWQNAPMPRFPDAITHACREALAGITGAVEGNNEASGGQVALFARAEACIAALSSHVGQDQVCQLLRQQLEAKRKFAFRPWYKNQDVVGALFLSLFLLPVAWAIFVPGDAAAVAFLERNSGRYSNGSSTLDVSVAALALDGERSLLLWPDNSNYTQSVGHDSGVTFMTKSSPNCNGSITRQGDSLLVAVSAKDGDDCSGFTGTWNVVK